MNEKQTIEPRNPKGMRDFLPAEKRVRDAVLKSMISVFESYGFEPLETPAVELKGTLSGKIGSEEKLIFDVSSKGVKEMALRYDLTVPLARVVAQYPDLPKPFKRYQIGNVFRGENTQKGRYRQFLQVDIDIVGDNSTLSEAEIITCTVRTYQKLGLKVKVLINSRALLLGEILAAGVAEDMKFSVASSIDKVGKIGRSGVLAELEEKGLTADQAKQVFSRIKQAQPDPRLQQLFGYLDANGIKNDVDFQFDSFLARGLDYYTETVFEVDAVGYKAGAVGGGGRYDNLIGNFSGQSVPAVGFSFGFDRFLEALAEKNILPTEKTAVKVLVTIWDDRYITNSLKIAEELRMKVPTELYSGSKNRDEQIDYAVKKGIPFSVILGPRDIEANKLTLVDLSTRERQELTIDQALKILT